MVLILFSFMGNIFLEVRDQIIMNPSGNGLLLFRSQLCISVLNFGNEKCLLEKTQTGDCSYLLRLYMWCGLDFLIILVEGETCTYTDEYYEDLGFLLVNGASEILAQIQSIITHMKSLNKEAKDFL